MKNKSGFTLAELIVVMAIIAVSIGIATPNLLSWRVDRELAESLKQIVSVLNSARIIAIKENARTVVVFDESEKYFRSFVDLSRTNEFDPDQDRPIAFYKFPASIDISRCTFPKESKDSDRYRAVYRFNGLPSHPGRVVLESRKGTSRGVVLARTGRIRTE